MRVSLAVLVTLELPAQTAQQELPVQREPLAQLGLLAPRELLAPQELPAPLGLPARQELWGLRVPSVRRGLPAQLVQTAHLVQPAEPADSEPPGQQEQLVSAPWAALAPSGPAHLVEQAPSALSQSAPQHRPQLSAALAPLVQPEQSLQEAQPEQQLAPPVSLASPEPQAPRPSEHHPPLAAA